MNPERRRAILTSVVVAILLAAEFAFMLVNFRTTSSQSLVSSLSIPNIATAMVRDPRFVKLSTAAITAVKVGETGRENPFEPTQ